MNTRRIMLLLLVILLGNMGCNRAEPNSNNIRIQSQSTAGIKTKKVILILTDSLMPHAIERGIQQKSLPTLQYLIEHGQYYNNVVSSFPTMSVTIDSSLLTGSYPDEHYVPGLTWFSIDEKKVINYGTGPMEIMRHGLDKVLNDAIINLNGKHLNPNRKTIYEELAKYKLTSASINGFIYRGVTNHNLSIPIWARGLSSLPKQVQVKGPDILALGAISNPYNVKDGITNKLGLSNQYSIETVRQMVKADQLPNFTLVYLPDLDHELHKHGPSDIEGPKKIDQDVRSLLEAFGSLDKALEQTTIVIAGDSGMTPIYASKHNPVIDLPELFADYEVLRTGAAVSDKTEMILAVNETMSYIYKWKTKDSLRTLAETLAHDSRVDIAAWKEKDWIHVLQGGTKKEFRYRHGGEFADPYGQKWTINKDPAVLNLQVNPSTRSIEYGLYPDALQRLSSSLNSHQGEFIVATAKPGYEFADRSSPLHKNGGGHGALRRDESLVPLLICGTDEKPQHLRIVDIKQYLLKLLVPNP